MSNEQKSFVIGVTGHRDLRECDLIEIEKAVRQELRRIRAAHPNTSVVMCNALAAGADQLCAKIALELGIRLVCPLPMAETEYEKDFSDKELAQFRALLSCAQTVYVAPHREKEKPGRDYLYRQSGLHVADTCDVLLALWDGAPGKPDGCGTAEIVEYHLQKAGRVVHIATPRKTKGSVFPIQVYLLS